MRPRPHRWFSPLLLAIGCGSTPDAPAVRHLDHDGDGRTDAFVSRTAGGEERRVDAPEPGSDPRRTVVLAIDGIPHAIFARLQARGRFRAFFPASRMVAPFPSLTALSFSAIFRTGLPLGYEDRTFDPAANAIMGGVADRVSGDYRAFAPYHRAFDFEAPRFWGGFVFLAPERVALAELERARRTLESDARTELVVYLGTTDGLGHELGHRGLERHLVQIDRMLELWLAEGGGSQRVVLVSDHGMTDRQSRMLDLETGLVRAGWRLTERIETPRDVVATPYGLIGSIHLYTACGREREVARAVSRLEGVDFAAWQDGRRTGVVDRTGSRWPGSERPEAEYPDLARRVRQGLAATRHPASVLASLDEGWHYGLELFEPFVSLAGTHGSARAASSIGLLASNVEATPDELVAAEVHPYLGLREPVPADTSAPVYACVDPPPPSGRTTPQ